MEDIMKIVKSLAESELLIQRISEAIKNEIKEQKCGYLSMLLGTLAASLLGNALTERGVYSSTSAKSKLNSIEVWISTAIFDLILVMISSF